MPFPPRRKCFRRGGGAISPTFFEVKRYRVTVERRKNKYNKLVSLSEAVVVVKVDGEKKLSASESMDEIGSDRGPVNALSKALTKDLGSYQKLINDIKLVDFKVRITQGGTEAVTRVVIDSEDENGVRWSTVGKSSGLGYRSPRILAPTRKNNNSF